MLLTYRAPGWLLSLHQLVWPGRETCMARSDESIYGAWYDSHVDFRLEGRCYWPTSPLDSLENPKSQLWGWS